MKMFLRWGFAFLLLIGVGIGLLVWEINRFAEIDQTRPAEAAIVLGAGAWGTRPSPILRERINQAVDLYHSGMVQKVIFTGGIGRRSSLSEAAVAREYALGLGVSDLDILIEDRSTNTIENLTFARQIAAAADLDSFLLVSTPYHMKRAMWIAADLEMEAYSAPTRSIRWISSRTQRRALVQETVSFIVHIGRRFSPGYWRLINSQPGEVDLS